jgi:hypothetical protein
MSIVDERKSRIEEVIREHYEDKTAEEVFVTITHVANDLIYVVQLLVIYLGDDEYTIHTETVKVEYKPLVSTPGHLLAFTLLSEHDLDLRDAL